MMAGCTGLDSAPRRHATDDRLGTTSDQTTSPQDSEPDLEAPGFDTTHHDSTYNDSTAVDSTIDYSMALDSDDADSTDSGTPGLHSTHQDYNMKKQNEICISRLLASLPLRPGLILILMTLIAMSAMTKTPLRTYSMKYLKSYFKDTTIDDDTKLQYEQVNGTQQVRRRNSALRAGFRL